MLLPDIDAELTVWDNDRAPWSEELLPVAELLDLIE